MKCFMVMIRLHAISATNSHNDSAMKSHNSFLTLWQNMANQPKSTKLSQQRIHLKHSLYQIRMFRLHAIQLGRLKLNEMVSIYQNHCFERIIRRAILIWPKWLSEQCDLIRSCRKCLVKCLYQHKGNWAINENCLARRTGNV